MNKKATVLLIEDDLVVSETYKAYLSNEPINLVHVTNGTDVLEYCKHTIPEVLILDLMLPDMNGMDILKRIKQRQLNCAVIIITGQKSANITDEAMRYGAFNLLEKPFEASQLLFILRNAIRQHDLYDKLNSYQKTQRNTYHDFIGASNEIRTIYQIIDTIATAKASIFIEGESGTGKELCAVAIHKESLRKDKPFIALNCGAFPKDLIESELFGHVKGAFTGAINNRDGAATSADGGTLFLDEIGEMDITLQTILLRFVQTSKFRRLGSDKEEKVDIRFICATNRDIKAEIKAGRFRKDLYYRLNIINLKMPTLRQRGDDILLIAKHFLSYYAKDENKSFQGLTPEVEQQLLDYHWPGNVRELQNLIHRIVVMNNGKTVTVKMLSTLINKSETQFEEERVTDNNFPTSNSALNIPLSLDAIRPLKVVEKEAIIQAMKLTKGNVTEAAKRLGVAPLTIYRKYESWGEKLR
ncbi:sigma-54 dependent transcriptional regulator [Candidatus Parabeggiatoa sp. HSG14]|uniref:sigma-54-dependent transcriptional regulator n=1 Tax=Candidatus Parabeggiatoa sp. HSG14 TaxID=3055593 RepID=UPI0025A8B4C6|nr:sigma-54 dependent transcriptional regulator [Thiotrichales bacterium HSG14]